LPALLTYHGQVLHLAIVAFVIGGVPADTIGGSFFLMWIPAAAITAVHWSNLRAARPLGVDAPTSPGGAELTRPWRRPSSSPRSRR
jgi:hypothetical protein